MKLLNVFCFNETVKWLREKVEIAKTLPLSLQLSHHHYHKNAVLFFTPSLGSHPVDDGNISKK